MVLSNVGNVPQYYTGHNPDDLDLNRCVKFYTINILYVSTRAVIDAVFCSYLIPWSSPYGVSLVTSNKTDRIYKIITLYYNLPIVKSKLNGSYASIVNTLL
jgi:hypothetical protein